MILLDLLLLSATLVGIANAQESGWQTDQVNATMCQWQLPRAGVIRDVLYLDGGYLFWEPGMADGSYGAPTQDGNLLGLLYTLNFSQPFNISQNLTQILQSRSKTPGAANNIVPQYYDGTMFANDGEFYTYGGLLSMTDQFTYVGSILKYEAYWYGALDKDFRAGFLQESLQTGITRYITGGAGVSIPSENLGFYFSGLKSASAGPIFYPSVNQQISAEYLSNTLISVDMTVQRGEIWKNTTLPSTVPGRSNAEIVWIPIGKRGVLVALGGVIDPAYAFFNNSDNASQKASSQAISPTFMSTVAVYDIDSGFWYMQPTNGMAPSALTQGCAVAASSQDGSSHNIYWYGGFDGINGDSPDAFSDDVWILSIPSFMWMRVTPGNSGHARAGHRCIKPYPDQMMVIGGYTAMTGDAFSCLNNSIIQLYNLSSTSWIDSYDPAVWSNYTVPEMIYNMIGGGPLGGATEMSPSSGAWANTSMAPIFGTGYDMSKVKNWYPYAIQSKANTTRGTVPVSTSQSSSGLPSWVAPVLGVVLGLIVLSVIAIAFILWKRRKFLRAQSESGTGSSEVSRHRIMSWVRGADVKAATVTSEDVPSSPYDDVDSNTTAQHTIVSEAGGNQVHEMPDNSVPQELMGTGMSYIPPGVYSAYPQGLKPTPSVTSRASKSSHKSESSNFDRPRAVSPLSAHSPVRPDSPPLGSEGSSRIVSGVSTVDGTRLSDITNIGPMGLSGGSQADTTRSEDSEVVQLNRDPINPLAVSPPTPRNFEGGDYLSGSPRAPNVDNDGKRKSNFGEILNER